MLSVGGFAKQTNEEISLRKKETRKEGNQVEVEVEVEVEVGGGCGGWGWMRLAEAASSSSRKKASGFIRREWRAQRVMPTPAAIKRDEAALVRQVRAAMESKSRDSSRARSPSWWPHTTKGSSLNQ
ncbi:hypothetical protein TorRG33x02_153820 [Trema orientale]|uniref:Uncharacterized protein n=1 Tax=Trema orientale TaxID=63057 RepID=A0A2P5ETM3_TREOI|nr:hypothetical protein TorRG33x02_153820 [Trema orientale]